MMRYVSYLAALPVYLAVLTTSTPGDAPTARDIEARLDKAKKDYRGKLEALAAPVLKELDRLEATARKKPDRELLAKIQSERDLFQQDGAIPNLVRAREYRRGLSKPREVLRKAFREARDDYTRIRRDGDAERTRRELLQIETLWASYSALGEPYYWGPRAAWIYDGDELCMTDPGVGVGGFRFGNVELGDFDLVLDAKVVGGNGDFGIQFLHGEHGFCQFMIGRYNQSTHTIEVAYDHKTSTLTQVRDPAGVRFNQWFELGVRARGGEFWCYIDGKECLHSSDARYLSGRIGMCVEFTALRVRNIRIATADGKTVFSGLPKLPR